MGEPRRIGLTQSFTSPAFGLKGRVLLTDTFLETPRERPELANSAPRPGGRGSKDASCEAGMGASWVLRLWQPVLHQ